MKTKCQDAFGSFPEIYNELPQLKTDKIVKWLRDKIFTERYLFYNKEKQQAICSNCGAVEMPEDVKHNSPGTCPKCGAAVAYKSMGIGRGRLENRVRVLIFQRRGKSVYATLNMIYADYQDYTVQFYKDCEAVYKFNKKEQQGYYTEYGWYYGGRWSGFTNIRVPYRTGTWKDADVVLYAENIQAAFKGTDLKYCQLPEQAGEWSPSDFLKLVDLNAKFESVEKIHKVGLREIIESKVNGQSGSAGVRWKKNNLKDILGIPLSEIPVIREAKFTMYNLLVYKTAKKLNLNILPDQIEKYDYIDILGFKQYQGEGRKLFSYLNHQLKMNKSTYYRFSTILKDYKDYLMECEKLELDLKDKTITFPRSLHRAHARTSAQVQAQASRIEQERIAKVAARMKECNFNDGDLLIRIAESADEIILEGKLQHHCVGGYVKKVADGLTNIFFVRKAGSPDEPYYTLELDKSKKIVQCRGKLNCGMTEEVALFIDKWHQEVVLGKKSKPKKQSKVA